MNRRDCCSRRCASRSFPQYGQRFHPSGYVFLQAVQRMLFGSGIVRRRALYTSKMEEERRDTLLALIHMAEGDSPSACWDDLRAIELLRKQASREEQRELAMDERFVEYVVAETNERR